MVFDFIRPDIAEQILLSQIGKIIRSLAEERRITLSLSETALSVLMNGALANLDNGGRGIGNIVENMLINPLSRYIFDENIQDGESLTIEEIIQEEDLCTVRCRRKP